MTKPVEIFIDDIHIICDTPAHYDKEFVERFQHALKKEKFKKLLEQLKVSSNCLKTQKKHFPKILFSFTEPAISQH